MKYIFAFLFFSVTSVFSQEIIDTSKSLDIIKSHELKGDAWESWNKIQNDWMKKEYPTLLKSNKLKMNCDGCSTIYLDVVLQIDTVGKLTYYKLIDSRKCAEKFSKPLEIQFMKSFFKIQFPESLQNMRFQVRLGTGLKC